MLHDHTQYDFLFYTFLGPLRQLYVSIRLYAARSPLPHSRSNRTRLQLGFDTNSLQDGALGVRGELNVFIGKAEVEYSQTSTVRLISRWLDDPVASRRIISSAEEIKPITRVNDLINILKSVSASEKRRTDRPKHCPCV